MHWTSLTDRIDCQNGLIGHLFSQSVIDSTDKSVIEAEQVTTKRNGILLSFMQTKSKQEFEKFCDALRETGQSHIVTILQQDQQTGELSGVAKMND